MKQENGLGCDCNWEVTMPLPFRTGCARDPARGGLTCVRQCSLASSTVCLMIGTSRGDASRREERVHAGEGLRQNAIDSVMASLLWSALQAALCRQL